ncbi:YggT family protein [Desulfoluna limicola]|uniref:YggT family protein n=1 Tax=Desulfoluna limicola TaxID=2810562 RepID=A0ABM7PN70_9BACT|nr:YggT family protein [Desulfoluna limicola]BCS98973.1 YggT family protein [Desulfoluna limicola]
MFIIANFIKAVAVVLDMALTLYMFIVIARAILSWVSPDPYNPIVRFIHNATEPVLYRVRSKIPYMGGLDLSPLVVIAAIYFLRIFVVDSLYHLARMM